MADERTRAVEFDRHLSAASAEPMQPASDERSLADFALHVRQTLQAPAPRAAFTASARRRLLKRLPAAPTPRLVVPTAVRRFAFAAVSVLLAFSLGTASVAYAAQEAIPGEALYSVKRGLEAARWSLTTEPEAQVDLLASFAGERVREVEALTATGSGEGVTETLEAYQQTLEQLQLAAESLPPGVRAGVIAQAEAQAQQHAVVLERVRSQVPEQAQAGIERALERTSHHRDVLEQIEQAGDPSDLAPGQNKDKSHGPQRTPGPPDGKGKP